MAIPTNDEIWADFNLDGSVKEPFKQDIRRKMNFIEALATAAGSIAKVYSTKAAMDADLSQPDGTIGAIYADPVDANNYPTLWYWNDAGNVWVMGVDRLATMHNQANQSTAAADGIYLATGAPRPVAWMDTSSYLQTWVTITNPATRFTITPATTGYTVTGLAGLGGSVWPVGVKLPYDLVPGDAFTVEVTFTAGTLTTSTGVWFGTDPTTTGDISTSARLTCFRAGTLAPCTQNGLTADGTRTLTPAFLPTGASIALNVPVQIMVDVLLDRTVRFRVFQGGFQVAVDVVVAPATALGAVIIGVNIANGQTATITRITRRTSPAAVLYINSGVSGSGDGTMGSPLKSLTDVPKAIVDLGIAGRPITINCLTDNVYGYLELKDTLSPRWTINGIAGGNTTLNGFNFGETPTWTVVAGTSNKVWSTPTKLGPEVRSTVNQPFIFGLSWLPRAWYNFPNTALPLVTTANGGVDMQGLTAGAYANTGGVLYMRLPDGLPSYDPNAYPTGGYSIIVSRTQNILKVVGACEVNLNNLTLRWASGPTFLGGAGFGTLANCYFEWGGYNSPNIEVQNGNYLLDGGHSKYSDGDGYGRSPRVDIPYQVGSTLITRIRNFEISHTGTQAGASGGDGGSDHIFEDGTSRRCVLYMENVHIHDCWKCGYTGNTDYLFANGLLIERCGTAQFTLLGVSTASGTGRTQVAHITNFRFDPQNVGLSGANCTYTDGMALCELQLDNGWIGTPTGVGSAELLVSAQALAGQSRDLTKNRIVYRNVTTERASPVKTGGGTGGTFVPVAAYPLT